MLQFHIAQEETKFGLSENEASELVLSNEFKLMKNVRIVGVMGMASFTEDNESVRNEFQSLKKIFTNLKNKFFSKEDCFKEISMGMSGDFCVAIEEGATLVRVGTAIFGERSGKAWKPEATGFDD